MDWGRRLFTLFLAAGIALPCTTHGVDSTAIPSSDTPQEWVVVFVHGIMSIKPHITFGNITRFFEDQIRYTQYARTIKTMRNDHHFFKNQAMQERGLVKVDIANKSPGNSAGALGYVMNGMERLAGVKNRKNHYYTYGWSGLLSQSSRYREAARFFHDLQELVKSFKRPVNVRVIGYSHGGCVSLELAAAQRDIYPDSPLKIDELVLIATPIQHAAAQLVASPLFKRVYNLHSRHDRVQRIDIFNPNRYLSDRLFEPCNGFSLPEKIIQVELKLIRNHSSVTPGTVRHEHLGNFENPRIVEGYHRLLTDASPGHGEVWFFGWTPQFYRKSFPLYPLPMISVLPFLQRHLSLMHGGEAPRHSIIVADVRPDYGTILFKRKYNKRTCLLSKESFATYNQLRTLTEGISPYIPKSYSKADYMKHIDIASREARRRYKEKKKRFKGKNPPLSRSCAHKMP